MDQYKLIRQMHSVQGMSDREIAQRVGVSRKTVRRYREGGYVPWERSPGGGRPSSVLTPDVVAFVTGILESDRSVNPKQRHTARRIHERLRDEKGFGGSDSTIRHLVAELRDKPGRAFIPLRFEPGEAAQVDWGTAKAIIDGHDTEVHLFCMRLCYSCAPFVMAFPSEREEAFLEGHKQAFAFFGGAPRRLIYDNLRTAVKTGWGKQATVQDALKAFMAHYAYESSFCNPGEGHEKGLVEGLVRYIRNNALVPVPRVANWSELNELLLDRCRTYIAQHKVASRDCLVSEGFELERKELTPLPVRAYEACKVAEAKVDHFSMVTFDRNQYSVPVRWAQHLVTIRASAFAVSVYRRGELLAAHERSYSRSKCLYKMEHYLPLLERSPRAVANARPVKESNLPVDFWKLAFRLPEHDRGLVRLLRLVVNYGLPQVMEAIDIALKAGQYTVEAVIQGLHPKAEPTIVPVGGPPVMAVDMSRYDVLLEGGAQR